MNLFGERMIITWGEKASQGQISLSKIADVNMFHKTEGS